MGYNKVFDVTQHEIIPITFCKILAYKLNHVCVVSSFSLGPPIIAIITFYMRLSLSLVIKVLNQMIHVLESK